MGCRKIILLITAVQSEFYVKGTSCLLQNYYLFHLSYRELCCALNDRFCLTVLCGVSVCLYVEMSLTLTLNYLEKVSSDEEYFVWIL